MIINGYKIPGGKGGLAVRIAAELIIKNPGIKQGELLERACLLSELNLSTAGWITTPGKDRSPAEKLWTRQKIGRGFCLFPNEWTQAAADGVRSAYSELVNKTIIQTQNNLNKWFGREIRVSDLLQLDNLDNYDSGVRGVVIGFKVTRKHDTEKPHADGFSNSIDEALQAWNKRFETEDLSEPQSLKTLVLKASGQLEFYCGSWWHGRLISDPPPVWKIQVKNTFTTGPRSQYPILAGQTLVQTPDGGHYYCSPSFGERSEERSWKTKAAADVYLEKLLQKENLSPGTLEVVLF